MYKRIELSELECRKQLAFHGKSTALETSLSSPLVIVRKLIVEDLVDRLFEQYSCRDE